jgi:RNA recognition motif-containing protein
MEMDMSKRVYVGNLSFSVTDGELEEYFQQFGEVNSATVITDRETGRSRGFGFVEMSNDGDADEAIEKLNGQEWEGRTLTVNEAKPREERGRGGGGGGRGRGGGGGRRY